jgi:NADH-quinone oxidoreductase subunit M
MLLGLLYERYSTYDMREYGGLAAKLPWVATMFVITTLSVIGLPMLNSFVGEFLILSGSMQSIFAHHHFWTALATVGVILSAAYMLSMIQRVFYCDLGPKPEKIAAHDLDVREHIALWPMVALFLVMGVASPIWLKAIDGAAVAIANHTATSPASPAVKLDAQTALAAAPGGVQ